MLLGILTGGSAAQEPAEPILEILRNASASELTTYALQVQVEQTVSSVFPEQGTYTKVCTISRRADGVALACETVHFPTPVYCPVGTGDYKPSDYDSDGNLVIWMNVKDLALWIKGRTDRNERYYEIKSFVVDPQGAVVVAGHSRILYRYPSTEPWSPPMEMRQIWWALGQDVAPAFQSVVSDTSTADGRRRLRVREARDRGPLKAWDVIIDPSAGHLIRSASFQFDDSESPPIREIETKGLRRFAGLALPEQGFVRINFGASGGGLVKTVVLKKFSHDPDETLFHQVRRKLDSAEAEGELTVFDYRDNPSSPTVTRKGP